MKSLALLLVLMLFSVAIPGTGKTGTTEIVPDIPAKNTVTMVDLGAKTCIPCKLMAPILEELEKEFKGRAAVIFIDVWENRDMSKAFRVVTIPTQIFYNKQGQEVYRHIGFFDKDSIKEKLDALIAE
jgi:thioredoxin 1